MHIFQNRQFFRPATVVANRQYKFSYTHKSFNSDLSQTSNNYVSFQALFHICHLRRFITRENLFYFFRSMYNIQYNISWTMVGTSINDRTVWYLLFIGFLSTIPSPHCPVSLFFQRLRSCAAIHEYSSDDYRGVVSTIVVYRSIAMSLHHSHRNRFPVCRGYLKKIRGKCKNVIRCPSSKIVPR